MSKMLCDVAEIIDSLHKTPKYKEKGFPMVRVIDVNNGFLELENCFTVDENTCDEHNKNHIPQVGDVIITRVGSYGMLAYVNTNDKFCLGQNIAIISPKVNGKFLYYYLKSPFIQNIIYGNSGGSSYKCISLEEIKRLPYCDSKLDVEKIGDLLYKIDSKIENNNKINSELESMAKTIYDYWFLQFEFPNNEGKPYKSSGGKMVWNDKFKKEIPEGWGNTTIGKITNCFDSKRIPLSAQERKLKMGGIPYYGATGIMDYVDEAIFDGDYVLVAEDGSVMDEKGYPILQRVSGKAWINNHAHVLQPSQSHCCKLLMMFLKDVSVMKIKTGSIQLKINQENLNKIPVLDIPQKIIVKVNEQLETIDRRILQLENEKQELISLRDFLLPLLMNGQVGFKD